MQIWTDNNSGAQKWQITANGDGTYKLINPNSGKALDVNGNGTESGTKVQIWTDLGSPAQKWQLFEVTAGTGGSGGTGGTGGSGPFATADYTAGSTKPSASQARLYFTPNGYNALYVDIHYIVGGGAQQNLRMTNNGGTWEQIVSGVSSGTQIDYWFTYEKNGPQFDSLHYTHTQ